MPPSLSVMHGTPPPPSAKETPTSWTSSAHAGTTTGQWQYLISAVCTYISSQSLILLTPMVHMCLIGPSLAHERSSHTYGGPDPLPPHSKTGLYGKHHFNAPLCFMHPRSSTHLVLDFTNIGTTNITFHPTPVHSNSPTSNPPRGLKHSSHQSPLPTSPP